MQILKIKLSQLQLKCNHDWASDCMVITGMDDHGAR
jgi:hypothetical protein